MHFAQARVGVLAKADRVHFINLATSRRQHFRDRCLSVRHDIVKPRATFNESGSIPHVQPGGEGGGGGVGDYFDRWNSDGGGWSGARVSIICLLLSCQALEAHASPKRNRTRRQRSNIWDDDPELNSYTTHLTDLAWPILQNLGFSGAVGLVCAVALKAIGRVVAIGLGTTFAIVQLLAYGGFITVEWSKMHEDILRICDVDGDRRFGATDLHDAIGSLLAMLSQGLPSASGFCLGFFMGLRL
ncbi:hypothetical protein ABBQ32_010164 [Trebouxia sp. C0010 RCD-2024]